jgi:beta-lactamase superfamily II metal-dependent hydrolase
LLDVGQGDATLVQGRRSAVLIDAGLAIPGGVEMTRWPTEKHFTS